MALRSTGQSKRRSIEPFSRSAAMVRPNPSKLAKTKATHNAPGATEALLSTRRSKAKLKMTSTSRANSPMPIQVCLLRSSQRISFQSMAKTCSRKIMSAPSTFQAEEAGIPVPRTGFHKGPCTQSPRLRPQLHTTPAPTGGYNASIIQYDDAVSEFLRVLKLVRRKEYGATLRYMLIHQCFEQLISLFIEACIRLIEQEQPGGVQ